MIAKVVGPRLEEEEKNLFILLLYFYDHFIHISNCTRAAEGLASAAALVLQPQRNDGRKYGNFEARSLRGQSHAAKD